MHNNLRFYTLRMTESPEMAEKMALEFEDKFANLNKYDQVSISFIIDVDGWEEAFERIDNI